MKNIIQNKKARHDYAVLEHFEAGIELTGTEVKSCRAGGVSLTDAYAAVQDGQLLLLSAHIAPYEQGNRFNHDPLRDRRLLMHKREILRLFGLVRQQGLTLVPTKLYFKFGRVKVELGLARGKKSFDKRDSEARKQADRAIERRLKDHGRDDRD